MMPNGVDCTCFFSNHHLAMTQHRLSMAQHQLCDVTCLEKAVAMCVSNISRSTLELCFS